MRAAYPALRSCYEGRADAAAEGRVVFQYRIEQDGSLARVCAGEHSTMIDRGALRCMVEELRKVRFPGGTRRAGGEGYLGDSGALPDHAAVWTPS